MKDTYLKDALLHGLGHRKLVNVDSTSLAKSVGPVERLVLERRVPPGVDEDDVVAARQIQAYSGVPVR